MRLANKTAIVTGAASGIGRAIARRFAAEGAYVLVSDITTEVREGGEPTADVIRAEGGNADFRHCDVTDTEQIDALVRAVVATHGRLDVMVNNAVTTRFEPKPLIETSEQQWRQTIEVNLTGVFLCAKRAVQQMMTQEIVGEARGRLINLSSQFGFVAAPENCAYGVSKAGIAYLTRQIARDYAGSHIVCNAIAPGKILTGKPGHAAREEVIAFSHSRTPWPRLGHPNDIANAALFLASDEASFIQGEVISVDGGWLAA